MRIVPMLSWATATDPVEALDARLLPLLEAIGATGSLAAAVVRCGLSYRAAWGVLKDEQRRLGALLVVLERGRGASLAAAGARLVSAQRTAEQRLARTLSALAVELAGREASESRTVEARLSVAASHDPALAALRDALPAAARLSLELAFMGSLHALEQLRAGSVDVAGFHVASSPREVADAGPFRRLLDARRDRLIRFVDRQQGFILPRTNPERVRSFADVVRKRLRFVNRQRGSGTRLLIDHVLASEGVDPVALVGYANEEFTHAAVAATVASGAADAAFGLRAAAAEYGLAFVPRVRESYFLAVRARGLATPGVSRLVEALKGAIFARIVRRLRGYQRVGAGSILKVDALSSPHR
jgi:putative molybdopterin biosynthesis protein